jgi:hypothetical protein
MSSWTAWVQRPSGIIKVEGSTSGFKRVYLDLGRVCSMEVYINNRSYHYRIINYLPSSYEIEVHVGKMYVISYAYLQFSNMMFSFT